MDKMRKIAEQLIKNGEYKLTTQRRKILKILVENKNHHLSPMEIYEIANSKNYEIGMATIYRALQLFSKLDLVKKLETGKGKILYELKVCGASHSHFICLECGKVLEAKRIKLEDCKKYIPENADLIITDCSIRLFGYCRDCQKVKR